MTTLVLDAGALIALDRNDRDVWAMVRVATDDRRSVYVPTGAIGQAWRDGARQALLAKALRHCDELALDGTTARAAGVLCGQSRSADVIDASVAMAAAGASQHGTTLFSPQIPKTSATSSMSLPSTPPRSGSETNTPNRRVGVRRKGWDFRSGALSADNGERSDRVWKMSVPHSSVPPYGDISGDGTDDIVAAERRERPSGGWVYYTGIPCRTRPQHRASRHDPATLCHHLVNDDDRP